MSFHRLPIQPLRGTEAALAAAAADPSGPLEVDELCVATDTWRTYLVIDQGNGPELQLIGDGGGGGGGGYGAGAGLVVNLANIDVVGASGRIDVFADNIDLAQVGTAGTYDKVTTDTYGRVISGSSPNRGGAGLVQTGDLLDVVGTAGRIVVGANNVDLATVGTPGTYTRVSTDSWGRVTSGSNPTTLAGYGIIDAQPLDATLTALAQIATAVDRLIYATGSDAFATTALTGYARALLDDLNAAAARATLELGSIATQNADAVAITGGSISGATITGSSWSGGTIDSQTLTNGTIDGATITNSSYSGGSISQSTIANSSVAAWASGVTYKADDLVIVTIESEKRIFCATSSFTATGVSFPGGQSIATPGNGYAGEWREISPLRGNMGGVVFEGQMAYASSITPPTLGSTEDNYEPAGLPDTNFLRLEAGVGNGAVLTGLKAPNPVVNQGLFICNIGSKNITLNNDSSSSLPENRFLLGGNRTLQTNEGIMLIYDDVSLVWRSQAIQI